MQEFQREYKIFSSIHLNKVKRLKKLKKPIYNEEKRIYKKYNINSNRFNINSKEIQTYTAILQVGIVKELKQQGIINEEEMILIIRQLKKKNKLEVEFE